MDRVLREREQRRDAFPGPLATVFLGGGTPSRVPIPELTRLLAGIERMASAEVSAEVNPEDAGDAWLDGARAAGVTRVSVGVQSFDPRVAGLLGRAHTSAQATTVLGRVARGGFASWSADLIFAVPGQTLADLDRDLDALLACDPPHVSLYGLTFEPGTPFEARRAAGKLRAVDDGLWRAMYDRLVDRLEDAGIARYEVSNFARPGHRSAHNQGYWSGRPYLGLGPAAHGFAPDGSRWLNLADPGAWLAAEGLPEAHREHPTGPDAAVDLLVSALRCVDGLRLDHLVAASGVRPGADAVAALVRAGMLADDPDSLRLTHAAFPIADAVIARLARSLHR